MYDGTFKCVEEIVVGDLLMGDDSTPRTVLNTTSGRGQLYDVIQKKGYDYTVNANHILTLKASNADMVRYVKGIGNYRCRWMEKKTVDGNKTIAVREKSCATEQDAKNYLSMMQNSENYICYGDSIDISIGEYMKLSKFAKGFLKGYTVPVEYDCEAIYMNELESERYQLTDGERQILINKLKGDLVVDPYALGYWLGDGTSAGSEITTAEEEIVEYFEEFAHSKNLRFNNKGNKPYKYTISSDRTGKRDRNSFMNFLRRYNLVNNKHIPRDYLITTRSNRLRLLAGIIDSDGSYTNNTYDMCFKSERLTDDIIALARSLGFKATKVATKKTCTNGASGPVTGDYFRFHISGNRLDEIPVLLDRKRAYSSENIDKNCNVTGINVVPSEIGNYYGFELDGNGRFLLEDYTVTHNSTTTGHLIFDLGGIPEREMKKLRDEAEALGKGSFAFAFYMDRQKEERERGVTIKATTKEFFTDSKHYTIIDAPGHRDFIKNMITGSSQADVALIMVPADGNFATSLAKGNIKAGEVQGQTRQHSLLINLLGVKQIIIGVNKMDCDVAQYKKERFDEVANEMKSTLLKVGFKKDYIKNSVPIIPISGWVGDNLISKSEKMDWWKGCDVTSLSGRKVHIDTLGDALENFVEIPERFPDKALRIPISGVYKIKGTGDVLAGRVEQGLVKPGQEVIFLPTHTDANKCCGKIFTIEMHHKALKEAGPGKNIGMNIKGLSKSNMPRDGDIMILASDTSLRPVKNFTMQVKVLTHPGELKVGYTPIAFVRTSRSAVKMIEIKWKIGKSTGNKKLKNPRFIKDGEMAEIVFEPQQPFVVDTFENCEGLGRVAIMEGNSVVMLGKCIATEY